MPEALTESFCERCGTRYEFAAPTRLGTLRKTRGLISGLRNYIMSQDALGDAVGDAMRSEEETLAARQLEAFHESFNFCIQCRQYACTNCWNDSAGRCRTCVPVPGTDDLIERFEASFHAQHPVTEAEVAEMDAADLNRRLGVDAWPTADLETAASGSNGHASVEWPSEPFAPPADDLAPAAEIEPVTPFAESEEPAREPMDVTAGFLTEAEPEAVIAETEPEPEPVVAEPVFAIEAVGAVPEAQAHPAMGWEDDAAFELEPEPVVAEVAPEPEPEPEPMVAEVAPEPEPEPVVAEVAPEPEPEPVVAEVAPEPEPPSEPAPERPILPISETILHVPRHQPVAEENPEPVAAEAEDPALAARRAKLDVLGLGDPGEGPVSARPNVLPYRSSGASVHPAELAARGDVQGAATAAGSFWEASAREVAGVMTQVGVQSCGACGLSLSASARFCRRCGTRQAKSA